MIFKKLIKRESLFLIGSLILVLSCKKVKDYPYNTNKEEFCELLAKMHEDDQKYRTIIQDPYFEIIDSILTANGLDVTTFKEIPKEEQLAYTNKAKEIADNRFKKFTAKEEDSIMQLQIIIDNSNAEKLIKITQEFGWPLKNRVGCTEYFAPFLIFRHAQPQYHKTIKKVIDKVLKEGQMEKTEYAFILNHLNGRPNNFEIPGDDDEVIKITN